MEFIQALTITIKASERVQSSLVLIIGPGQLVPKHQHEGLSAGQPALRKMRAGFSSTSAVGKAAKDLDILHQACRVFTNRHDPQLDQYPIHPAYNSRAGWAEGDTEKGGLRSRA